MTARTASSQPSPVEECNSFVGLKSDAEQEALAVLAENRVDLILCDINMPVMDGLELVKQLSGVKNAKGVPVVMITTEGSESHVVQALSYGARGYIRKPFTPEQVREQVLPVLEVHEKHQ